MINLQELRAQTEVELEAAQTRQKKAKAEIQLILDTARQEGRSNLTEEESVRSDQLFENIQLAKGQETGIKDKLARLTALEAEEREADKRMTEVVPTGAKSAKRDGHVTVGREERTYNPDSDPRGTLFLRDVAAQFISRDVRASERLSRHMQEERVERPQYQERSTTSSYSGLVIPQYLVDMVAPAVANLRPFADICNHHPLPADGMSVNIPLVSTASSAALQGTENTGVSNTDMASTMLTANIQTAAGQQTLSRQAVERGSGIEDIVLQDLFVRYNTALDSTLFTQATTGLAAASTTTDPGTLGSPPTVGALYPQLAAGASRIEQALLGYGKPSHIVMHSRRWYWLASQLGSSWPFINTPGVPAQSLGELNDNSSYGNGFRGSLPFGLQIVVDNNVPVASGADDIYVVPSRECHLWEDQNAPVMIRAEQPAAASLGILLVVYGYFAYTFKRYTGATQRIASATNLVLPAGF